MATKVTKYVNTDTGNNANDGESATPWASMKGARDWLIANKPNLTSLDEWVEINFSGTAADTTRCDWASITTDSTRKIVCQATGNQAATAEGWKTDRYRLYVTNNSAMINTSGCVHLEFYGLQIGNANSSFNNLATVSSAQTYTETRKFVNCYIWCITSGSVTGNYGLLLGSGRHILNNVVIRGTSQTDSVLVTNSGDMYFGFLNVTVSGGSAYGFKKNNLHYLPSSAQNILVCNCSGSCFGGAGSFTAGATVCTNNASTDTTAPGTDSRISQTFTFQGAGDGSDGNFRLASTDAGAKDYGIDASGSTFWYVGSSTDIDGNVRAVPWDIGAHELVTTGSTKIIYEHLSQGAF